MKYHQLTPSELETYNVGYMVGSHQIVIINPVWESDQERAIYRKGYNAGIQDWKRKNQKSALSAKSANEEMSALSAKSTMSTLSTLSKYKQSQQPRGDYRGVEMDMDMVMEEKKEKGVIGEKGKGTSDSFVAELERQELSKTKTKRFTPPTLEEVKAYCLERRNNINAGSFIDYYQSKGWLVGKTPMKDWKAAVRTWERRQETPPQKPKSISHPDYVGEGSFLRRAEDDPFCADL